MKINKTLFIVTCCSFVLILLRVKLTHSITYMFLIWNLFLAGIPYLISESIKHYLIIKNNNLVLLTSLFVWLLFLPNAPYIITDLIHLKHISNYELWFDIVLVTTFAINGLIFGSLSMCTIHTIIKKKWNDKVASVSITMVAFLSGYGIYLGRLLRWNSWDVLKQPKLLLFDIIKSTSDTRMWNITLSFGVLILITFLLTNSSHKKQKAITME